MKPWKKDENEKEKKKESDQWAYKYVNVYHKILYSYMSYQGDQ